MTASTKIAAGAAFPSFRWPIVGGGTLDPAAQSGWRALIVYRGKHCPLCKKYLGTLNQLAGEFEQAGIAVAAVSADPQSRAEEDVRSEGWKFPVACELSVEQMRALGLYVSEPRSPQETDRPYAEPGVFVINPQGQVHIVDVSNAPFSRPDLQSLLNGIRFIQSKDYPIRGTFA